MKEKEYDVAIVGAGIGGLTCGCMLAQAGLKVLIAEKNVRPGGYCFSFEVRGFQFDACVHSLGNLAKGRQLGKVLDELGLYDQLEFVRHNPNDTIIAPDLTINLWNDLEQTITDLIKIFPHESDGIRYFFKHLINMQNMQSVSKLRRKTFRNILDEIFTDKKLKSFLSINIFGDLGMPASKIDAFVGVKHFYQFIVDGGYCPKGGMQALPDALAKRFQELGGTLLLSNRVKKILVKKKKVNTVVLSNGELIKVQFVVSGCDAKHTFFELIGEEFLSGEIINEINSMEPSLSVFVIYLGLNGSNHQLIRDGVNTWVMLDYDYENSHLDNVEKFLSPKFLLIKLNYTKKGGMVLVTVPYKTENFWQKNKKQFMENVLAKIERAVPGLSKICIYHSAVDPRTLSHWTMNFQGAAYGWAATPNQFMKLEFTRDSVIKNLFLCGHWSTIGQGIPGTAIVGERVANIILTNIRKKIKIKLIEMVNRKLCET